MNKILIILILSFGLIGNSYAQICNEDSNVQNRNGVVFLPNKTKSYSGQNLCIYDNGQYKVKGDFTDGLKDGKWTYWTKNGIKKTEETYELGNIQTKTIFSSKHYKKIEQITYSDSSEILKITWDYHPNGQLSEEKNFINNMLHGRASSWYENGQLHYETNYKNGLEDGLHFAHYKSGGLVESASYQDGKLIGVKSIWKESGQKEGDYKFINDEHVSSTIYKYHSNGQLKEVYETEEDDLFVWPREKRQGEYLSWFENGQKKSAMNFKDNEVHGKATEWYENGQIRQVSYYKDGLWHGKATNWYEDGQLKGEVSFKENKLDGKVIGFYSDGSVMVEGEYTDNNGMDTWWYKNGNQAALLPIIDGRKEGLVFLWNEDGSKKQSGYFNENKANGKQTWYYAENNQEKLIYSCLNGSPVGNPKGLKLNGESYNAGSFENSKVLVLHSNGKIKSEHSYSGALFTSKEFGKNGKLQSEFKYIDSKLYSIKYNEDGTSEKELMAPEAYYMREPFCNWANFGFAQLYL